MKLGEFLDRFADPKELAKFKEFELRVNNEKSEASPVISIFFNMFADPPFVALQTPGSKQTNPFAAAAFAQWRDGEDGEVLARMLAEAFRQITDEGIGPGKTVEEFIRLTGENQKDAGTA